MSAWPVVLFIRAGEDENEASWEVPAHWSQQQGKTDLGGQALPITPSPSALPGIGTARPSLLQGGLLGTLKTQFEKWSCQIPLQELEQETWS